MKQELRITSNKDKKNGKKREKKNVQLCIRCSCVTRCGSCGMCLCTQIDCMFIYNCIYARNKTIIYYICFDIFRKIAHNFGIQIFLIQMKRNVFLTVKKNRKEETPRNTRNRSKWCEIRSYRRLRNYFSSSFARETITTTAEGAATRAHFMHFLSVAFFGISSSFSLLCILFRKKKSVYDIALKK